MTPMELIDSHTHLDRFARAGELPAVLERAAAAGVVEMITVGTEPEDWALYAELAREHRGRVHFTVGLHPCSVEADWREAVDQLGGFLDGPVRPVAIGETGLDRFHLPKKDKEAAERLFAWQRDAFRAHLDVAQKAGLPVVVHSRGAAAECIALIDEAGFDWRRVVFHCFADGPEEMAQLKTRGGRGSFTGIITYKSAENVRQAAALQGLERVMVETDAPYLTPEPHRGKRNEPALVVHTAERLAAVLGVSLEELAAVSTRNARAFFALESRGSA